VIFPKRFQFSPKEGILLACLLSVAAAVAYPVAKRTVIKGETAAQAIREYQLWVDQME